MSTKTLKPTNGTAKKPVTKAVTKAKTPIVASAQLNLETRIQRIAELQGLTAKRQRVLDTYNKLRTFQFSGDDSAMLEIKDASNSTFNTSNNNLISELTSHLQSLLEAKLKELNNLIVQFSL